MKLFIFLIISFISFMQLHAQKNTNCTKTQLSFSYKKNPNTKVFTLDTNTIGYVSEMTIDIDGSPQAYNPQDTGLDVLSSAGGAAHLSRSVIVFKGKSPYLQKAIDPFPGYYLSQTSLLDKHFADTDYRRYVNADSIFYISLPFNLFNKACLGDIAFVLNRTTGKSAFALIADSGDNTHIGEGSVALAKKLDIKIIFSKKKHQIIACNAVQNSIAYVVFNKSGIKRPMTAQQLEEIGNKMSREKINKYMSCLLSE